MRMLNVLLFFFFVFVPLSAKSQWSEQPIVPSSYNANMHTGKSVAISGDTAFVSAPKETISGGINQGAVYVYKKVGATWTLTQKLLAPDGESGDQFGHAVAVQGDKAIITSPFSSPNGLPLQGSAYYFKRFNNGVWVSIQKIWLNDGAAKDTFGNEVEMNDDDVFISAGGMSTTTLPGGGTTTVPRVVHTFRPGQNGAFGPVWEKTQSISSPVVANFYSGFGLSMAVSGDIALIGAYSAIVSGHNGRGAVYEYVRVGGSWVAGDVLVASDGGTTENFGVSVDLIGSQAAIGAQGAAINGNVSQGAAYIFDRIGTSWLQVQKIVAQDGAALNLFGATLQMNGNRLIVGAYLRNNNVGSAYIFTRTTYGWSQTEKLVASQLPSGSFGRDVALDGGTAIVGADHTMVNGIHNVGAAFIYTDPCWPAPSICTAGNLSPSWE